MNLTKLLPLVSLLAAQSAIGADAKTPSLPGVETQADAYFYTGKSFDQDLASYRFAYRDYTPGINRWASADPSGFPDGANNGAYAPVPTSELDWQGLLTLNFGSATWATGVTNGGGTDQITMSGYMWTATTKKGHTIQAFQMSSVTAHTGTESYDASANCHGYVFLPGFWIDNSQVATILADEWTACDEAHAKIVEYGGSQHTVNVTSTADGHITAVTGKDGHHPVTTTTLNGTGYSGPAFYE